MPEAGDRGAIFRAAGLGGCGDDVTGGDSGTMSLELTDAPAGDLSKAWGDIGTIALQGEGGETVLVDDPQGPDQAGFYELTRPVGDTKEELVSDAVVPAGTFTQLRIVIDAGAVETEDRDVFSFGDAASALGLEKNGSLQDASTAQTGIKVNLPEGGVTIEDDQKIVLLDFDVSAPDVTVEEDATSTVDYTVTDVSCSGSSG